MNRDIKSFYNFVCWFFIELGASKFHNCCFQIFGPYIIKNKKMKMVIKYEKLTSFYWPASLMLLFLQFFSSVCFKKMIAQMYKMYKIY